MILVKENMFLSIHTEDVWLVPLIKFYMKGLLRLEPDQFFFLPYTNLYLFTLYIMAQDFITNISILMTE